MPIAQPGEEIVFYFSFIILFLHLQKSIMWIRADHSNLWNALFSSFYASLFAPLRINQGFWYFTRLQSREFRVNLWNTMKFRKTCKIPWNSLEILPNTCRHNIFESYHGCWGCLLAVNLLIYLETSSLQQVNNISKLPGILRLMLRKTGKQPLCKKLYHCCISRVHCC